jgi:protein transport protein SEC20
MTTSLSARCASLSEANKTVSTLIQRLGKLNFQPGSVPLDGEEGDVRAELSSEIHESLKQQEEELELLKQEAEDYSQSSGNALRRRNSERDREKTRLSIQLVRIGEDITR